jgi:hypothetical protein
MFRRRFVAGAIVAAAAVMCSAATAEAGFQVTLYAPGVGPPSPVTIVDGGAGDSDGLANNTIAVISQVVGGYTFTFELAVTNTSGTPTLAFVNSSVGSVDGFGAGTIQIVVSANGFTNPVSPPDLMAISGATFQTLPQNTSGYNVGYTAALDTSNVLSTTAAGTVIGSAGPIGISSIGNASPSDIENIGAVTGPYTLNLSFTADALGSGRNVIDIDGRLEVRPVPAPAGLILAATALPFVGVLRRRLRRPEVATAA